MTNLLEPASPDARQALRRWLVSHGVEHTRGVEVLREPPDALTRQYAQQLALDDIQLQFTDDALGAIARAALQERCGARGLRSLMESVLRDLLFEAPERRGERVIIDPDFVRQRLAQRGSNIPTVGLGR